MSKVTSKLQLTVPKAIADQYGIRPGDELQWKPAGESIRIELGHAANVTQQLTTEEKLKVFDRGSQRLNKIQKENVKRSGPQQSAKGRGWKREELYDRGFHR